MALQIYTNNDSVVAQNNLGIANGTLLKSIERLSSGMRINHASDDAPGLAISHKLREQITGLSKATYNTQDAVSLLQTAEGGLEVIGEMLERMRELAVQAGNGTYTSNDRQELQKEIDYLKNEINRSTVATEYNTKKLLNGNAAGYWSANSADIEAVFRGVPAEGNYLLNFSTQPGQNAIYKSNILFTDGYSRIITAPNGVTNLEIGETNLEFTMTVVDQEIKRINEWDGGGGSYAYYAPQVIYSSNLDLLDNNTNHFAIFEDQQGPDRFDYAGDYFSGLYVGVEIMDFNDKIGQGIATGTAVGDVGGVNSDYIEFADGTRAFSLQDTSANGVISPTDTWARVFFMNPETGEKQYAQYILNDNMGYGGSNRICFFVKPNPPDTNDGLPIEIWLPKANLVNAAVDDKFVLFHQANSPNVGINKQGTFYPTAAKEDVITFRVEVALPEGSKTKGGNIVNYVYWDGESHAKFTVLTIQNGEFKEVDVEWDRDQSVAKGDISGEVSIRFVHNDTNNVLMKNLTNATNVDGRNVFDNTQMLTIHGNDRTAQISIEGNDTVQDFMNKLSTALVDQLQMGDTNINVADLVDYISVDDIDNGGIQSVNGTLIIQGALAGKRSDLHFIADEGVLNALGIMQLQESRESITSVSVSDAHTGRLVGAANTSDGVLRNVISGVDVSFDYSKWITTSYDSTVGKMVFTPDNNKQAYLHIVGNATSTQVGANEGQQFDMAVGRIDTSSLGIDDAYILSQKQAKAAITKFDQALSIVNSARATIGAQSARLGYTMNNIKTVSQNLTISESRISNLDVAEESAEFARNQILVNAAVAMLAQANQMPQTALQLIGR